MRPDIENRIKAGQIRALFNMRMTRIERDQVFVSSNNGMQAIPAVQVFALTGYHPDFEFIRKHGIALKPETYKPVMNPETHESKCSGHLSGGSGDRRQRDGRNLYRKRPFSRQADHRSSGRQITLIGCGKVDRIRLGY